MKQFFTLAVLISLSVVTKAQVNAYAKVTSIAGSLITVSNVNETYDRFQIGEEAIIMQMQDNVIGSTENNANFGNVGSLNGAGTYQLVRITELIRETSAGGAVVSIRLNSGLLVQFSTSSNASLQIISYPTLGNGNFTTTAEIKAVPWNGNVGGVVAFNVNGKLTVNHNISADGAGFRGAAKNAGNAGNCETVTYRTSENQNNGNKGESIYKSTNPLFAAGRGKILNGGGGGNSHNGGGGGGSNFTGGGEGGLGYGCSVRAGGLGGAPLQGFISGTRLFLGGGGGAGEANDGSNSAGGNGGGVIIIKAKEIATQGFSFYPVSITANGQSAPDVSNDGAGGGGAGGSILFDIPVWSVSMWRQMQIEANAGEGGSVQHLNNHGAGGGGGQGTVIFSTPVPTSNVSAYTLNGRGGRNSYFSDYAQSGTGTNNTGILANSMSLLPVKLLYFRGAQSTEGTKLQWNVTEVSEVNQFEIERSNDGQSFSSIAMILPIDEAQTKNAFSYTDNQKTVGNIYYRLKIVEANGKITYSTVVFIAKAAVTNPATAMTVYPNPAVSNATIKIKLVASGTAMVRVMNLQGSVVATQTEQVHKGESNISLNVSKLNSGVYTVQVVADQTNYVSRVIVSK